MNRRHLFVALVIAVPVAVLIPLKIAASWRPVKVAFWNTEKNSYDLGIWASARAVSDGNSVFDLKTLRAQRGQIALLSAAWTWNWGDTGLQQNPLVLQNGGKSVAFALPPLVSFPLDWNQVKVFPERDELQTTFAQHSRGNANLEDSQNFDRVGVCRWNLTTRHLQHLVFMLQPTGTQNVFSRDGESLIALAPDSNAISIFSTRTAKRLRVIALRGLDTRYNKTGGVSRFSFSAFGSYVLHTRLPESTPFYPTTSWGRTRWEKPAPGTIYNYEIVETRTGHVLWSYQLGQWEERAFFAPDEKSLAVPRVKRRIWEIRDTQTGVLVRTLPLMPGAQTGALSPDGATLYSIANGVLYCQRAR